MPGRVHWAGRIESARGDYVRLQAFKGRRGAKVGNMRNGHPLLSGRWYYGGLTLPQVSDQSVSGTSLSPDLAQLQGGNGDMAWALS